MKRKGDRGGGCEDEEGGEGRDEGDKKEGRWEEEYEDGRKGRRERERELAETEGCNDDDHNGDRERKGGMRKLDI